MGFQALALAIHVIVAIVASSGPSECENVGLLQTQNRDVHHSHEAQLSAERLMAAKKEICDVVQLGDLRPKTEKGFREIRLVPRKTSAKLIDTFAYGSDFELEELILRLYEMGGEIDEFHVVEGDRDFTGGRKPYHFESVLNSGQLDPWKQKIWHHKIPLPEGMHGYTLQRLQRDLMEEEMGLAKYDPRDVLLAGDLDEIVSRDVLKALKHCEPVADGDEKVVEWNTHILMDSYVYSLKWTIGRFNVPTTVVFFNELQRYLDVTNATKTKALMPRSFVKVESVYTKPKEIRLKDRPAGWHVSYMLNGTAGMAHKMFIRIEGRPEWAKDFKTEAEMENFMDKHFLKNPMQYEEKIQAANLKNRDYPQAVLEHPEIFPTILRDCKVAGDSSRAANEVDKTSLLQSSARTKHLPNPVDRSPEALTDLAERLMTAKKECLSSSMDCLAALTQVRYRVWPYVQELLHWNPNPWEPTGFHADAVKAKMNCHGDSNYTVMLMHTWKAAGFSTMRNLEAVSESFVSVESYLSDYRWCERVGFNSIDKHRRATFTFVREPLARFISGYAEIERSFHYDWLKSAPRGSVERAKVFIDRFLQDGAVWNGHVKPQSEFFVPLSSNCGFPIDFVGKIENLDEDWHHFMESNSCSAASKPFDHGLGQHPTNDELRDSLEKFLDGGLSLVQDRSSALSHDSHLRRVLRSDTFAYLRAFCWMHFVDYIMFDYDLPKNCNETEMLHIRDLTKKISIQ